MKTYIHKYSNKNKLHEFIKSNYVKIHRDILIQIFSHSTNKIDTKNLISNVLEFLPTAKIIGASTSGVVSPDGVLDNTTLISISYLKKTYIKTVLIKNNELNCFLLGEMVMKSFTKKPKLIISFVDGMNVNGEDYLNGITNINDNVIVSGGLAGDNREFIETIVFNESGVINNGAVAAGFCNDTLCVTTDYNFNWEALGKKHCVTQSIDNRIYTIDDYSTVDFYTRYLGKEISDQLPESGTDFPLLMTIDNVNIGRTALVKHDDGSMTFTGNIEEGTHVQFGYANVEMILEKSQKSTKKLLSNDIESIFVYSCTARKVLLKDEINNELLPLNDISPVSGFFTYGEFFYSQESSKRTSKLLNQTMTILCISEENNIKVKNDLLNNSNKTNSRKLKNAKALSLLMRTTTQELNDTLNLEIKKNIKKDILVEALQNQAQMGDMLEMIIHQWRQPLNAISALSSGTKILNNIKSINAKEVDTLLDKILLYTNGLNNTIEDFRDYYRNDVNSTNINLNSLIEKSLTICEALIKKYEINIIIENEIKDNIHVPVGLSIQVIVNILKNAIDELIKKKIINPKIIIKSKIDESYFEIEISDNAGGIQEDVLPNIFNKNFTTKDTNGTGIGLHMSKTIVEDKLNGKISAQTINKCAIFKITLPIN